MGRHACPPHRERDAHRARSLFQGLAEWEFFSLLRDEGRKSAQVFLETDASDLGRRSTLDIDVLLGQDLTNGTVAPATDLASKHVHAA